MLHLRDSRKNWRFEFANGKQLQLRLEKREEPVNESARHASGCRSSNMAVVHVLMAVVHVLMAVKQDHDGVVK